MNDEIITLSLSEDRDVHTIMLDNFDRFAHVATSSVIGSRSSQQDAVKVDFYSYAEEGCMIAVLCDGMGGLSGGEKASSLCSAIVHDAFHGYDIQQGIPHFYRSVIVYADEQVKRQTACAGTTMVSVVLMEDSLYWASVGDSHLYVIRGEDIKCVTNDHNYLMLLNERVKNGEITQEEANSHPKREALVSYIGAGGVRYIDMNEKPFQLLDGDHIVLCSDGLYRSCSEEEIHRVVSRNGNNTQLAADELTALAISKNLKNQDNTTVVVISYESHR